MQLLIKTEKRAFMKTCMKYLRGLYDLKRIVSGKNFEKYNAVQTQFDHFFLKEQCGPNRIVHDWNFLKVFEVVKGYKPE